MSGASLRKKLCGYFGPNWVVPVFIIDSYLKEELLVPAKGEVVQAQITKNEKTMPFSIMTWNILIDDVKGHNGVGNEHGRFDNIAQTIDECTPDVICIQEATKTNSSYILSRLNLLGKFADQRSLKKTKYYTSTLKHDVLFGQMVWSTYPMKSTLWNMDPKNRKGSNKHIVVSTIDYLGIAVCCVHLSAGRENDERRAPEIIRLAQIANLYTKLGYRVFAAGDFNSRIAFDHKEPLRAPESRLLPQQWMELVPKGENTNTFDARTNALAKRSSRTGAVGQFDYIFYSDKIDYYTCKMIVTTKPCSDHYPLLAHVM